MVYAGTLTVQYHAHLIHQLSPTTNQLLVETLRHLGILDARSYCHDRHRRQHRRRRVEATASHVH